tara:strand:+ start:189 stop:323 length:135 start_codon:yes stop_codon:yes gene_type:complete
MEQKMAAEVRTDQVKTYGIWAAVIGYAFGAALVWFMFAIADGFA